MTANEIKKAIEYKMAMADALVKAVVAGTAPAHAEDAIETLSNEIEGLSDDLFEMRRVAYQAREKADSEKLAAFRARTQYATRY